MAKRAAVIFTVLAIVLVQWLAADTQSPPELFMIGAPAVNQPRMAAPQMMAEWDYDVVLNEGDAQRRVIERLFRKAPPSALAAPSEDLALQMAAKEVIDIARSFGSAEGHFADKWVSRVMATEDPKMRLDILDECILDMKSGMNAPDCQGLDKALRRFRMLVAPHTALVKNAKQHVRALAMKFDAAKQRAVDLWLEKVEHGIRAEDPSEVLDECLVTASYGGVRSRDCFDFEEALRNFKSAEDLWAYA
jgi:ribosomal protein S21